MPTGHEYAIAFTVAGKLSSDFRAAIKNAQGMLAGTKGKLAELNRAAANVSGMMRHKTAVAEAARAHGQAKARMQELVRSAQQAGTAINRDSAEFKKAEAAIQRTGMALDKARKSMQAFSASSGMGKTSLQGLQAQQKGIQEQIAIQSRKDAGKAKFQENSAYLMAAGMYAADAMRSVIQTGMQFESEMAKVGAVSRASADDLSRLTKTAKDLGESTVWSASEAAQGMQYLSMAGFKVNETMAAMPGMLDLASAGAVDLGQAADIASNILTGFGLEAKEMGRAGDVLTNTFTSTNTTLSMLGETMKYAAPVAKNLGVSLEQAAAMAGVLGNAGIQGSEAGTGLRAVMLRLAKPSAAGAAALKQLGIQTADAAGRMRPYPELLAEIGQKMKALEAAGNTKAVASLSEALYGKNAVSSGMVLQTAAATGELAKLTEEVTRQGSAAEVAAKQNDTAAGRAKAFGSAVERFKINAFTALAPVLNGVAEGLTWLVKGMNALDDICPGVSTVLYSVLGGIALLTIAVPICTAVSGAFAAVMGLCASAGITLAGVMTVLTSPITLVVVAIGAAIAAGYLLIKNWDTLKATAIAAWTNIKSTVIGVINSMIDGINRLINGMNALGRFKVPDWVPGVGGKSVGLNIPQIPKLAQGGIVSQPTLAWIGEGKESEAVLPLSELSRMVNGGGAGYGGGIHVSQTITIEGGSADAYAQVKRGLDEGTRNLKAELERLMADQRRVSYA